MRSASWAGPLLIKAVQVPTRNQGLARTIRILLVSLSSPHWRCNPHTYNFPSARVAYTRVEQQFKLRGIPYTHVSPTSGAPVTTELANIQSPLARSVPALCVQSSDILAGAPAAEAAMPNIRVIPLNWWSDKKAQVRVTSQVYRRLF